MSFGCSFIDFMTLWSVQVRHQRLLVELFLCWVSVSVLSAIPIVYDDMTLEVVIQIFCVSTDLLHP
jgi:hypothetical protein